MLLWEALYFSFELMRARVAETRGRPLPLLGAQAGSLVGLGCDESCTLACSRTRSPSCGEAGECPLLVCSLCSGVLPGNGSCRAGSLSVGFRLYVSSSGLGKLLQAKAGYPCCSRCQKNGLRVLSQRGVVWNCTTPGCRPAGTH